MSFFTGIKNAFSGGGVDESVWNIPETENDVEQIFDRSSEKPQLIYKHSNSCSICWFTKSEIEAASESILALADLHFVNVVKFRTISNLISAKSGIIHHSPQVLIIQNGEVVWNASHGRIRANAILEQLRG